MKVSAPLRVGVAGWSIPRAAATNFPADGTHLERYARRLAAVEINSSFYRPHRTATYARWAESVPADFRFAVKVPKAITHEARLGGAEKLLETFLGEAGGLGAKLGVLLVQLPPGLGFDRVIVRKFFATLRELHTGAVACEPRHPSWITDEASAVMATHQVARVAPDPAPVPHAGTPGGWHGLCYFRLHGSPRTYYSAYGSEYLAALASTLATKATAGVETWCIFDNTALGHATTNALEVRRRI